MRYREILEACWDGYRRKPGTAEYSPGSCEKISETDLEEDLRKWFRQKWVRFGPDGKIYYSVGDRGAAVTTREGVLLSAPDTGSVFRCNPDGSQLELFATGLRNPQSLLFNENGDLLTGDNDCDKGDEERLVHVVEGGDSGWRIGYQFAPLEAGSPWLANKLWYPRHEGQAAYLIPPICNIEDGPSGITYYPGTGLNETYRGSIFITHFKGSVARSGISTYNVNPKGATYAIADAKPFLTSALPTDVKFGPDGRPSPRASGRSAEALHLRLGGGLAEVQTRPHLRHLRSAARKRSDHQGNAGAHRVGLDEKIPRRTHPPSRSRRLARPP